MYRNGARPCSAQACVCACVWRTPCVCVCVCLCVWRTPRPGTCSATHLGCGTRFTEPQPKHRLLRSSPRLFPRKCFHTCSCAARNAPTDDEADAKDAKDAKNAKDKPEGEGEGEDAAELTDEEAQRRARQAISWRWSDNVSANVRSALAARRQERQRASTSLG